MDLHNFMFTAVYTNPVCKGEEKKAVNMLINIYNYYTGHIDEMPEEYINIAQSDGEERAVCDYIAGMSDTYALKIFNKLLYRCFGMTDDETKGVEIICRLMKIFAGIKI